MQTGSPRASYAVRLQGFSQPRWACRMDANKPYNNAICLYFALAAIIGWVVWMGFYAEQMRREAKSLLYSDEKVHMFVRQPLVHSIVPMFVIATNRRIIIIRNSFWGLYISRNIFGSTSYTSIPYRQITSIMLTRGVAMCSVIIRLQGMLESSPGNEGEIMGLWGRDAENFVKLTEHMVEQHTSPAHIGAQAQRRSGVHSLLYGAMMGANPAARPAVSEVDGKGAIELINSYGTKLIWLGVEPIGYVASIMGVDESRLIKMDGSEILDMEYGTAQLISNHVLVCYNGMMAAYIASELKNKYNIASYVLKNGIISIMGLKHSYNKPI